MKKQHLEICENLGWSVNEDTNDISLQQYSPAGEDFFFYVSKKHYLTDICNYAEDFDPDEHAEMWVECRKSVRGVPQSIRTLIDDADSIKEMLLELSNALIKNTIKRS